VKYLLISDTHSNIEALTAVREAADHDRVVFLGDAVDYGPDPEAMVAALRDASREKGVLVQGNHDEGVSTPAGEFDDSWWSEVASSTMRFSRKRLDKESLAFLGGLPKTAELDLGAGGRALLCHGVPSSNREYLWPDLPEHSARRLLRDDTDGFTHLFVGHTHLQFERSLGALRVVNPGSVGQPRDGDPRAAFAVYDAGEAKLTFHRVKYDVSKTAAAIRANGMPHADRLVAILERGGG
jgi:predicted phosphodiesterase